MYRVGKCLLSLHIRRAGITQQQLADRSGIPKSNISEYINNRRVMTIETARTIIVALNNICHIDDLYEWIDDEAMEE